MRMMYRLGSGVNMDELDPAMDAVREIEPGDHYLGTQHTLANFETAFFMPELMDGESYENWTAMGGVDANTRGLNMAQTALNNYVEPALDDAVLAELDDYKGRLRATIPEGLQ